MRVLIDDELRREIEAFRLRFTCEDCLLYLRATGACAHEWPNEEHLRPPARDAAEVVFCKEFELR